MMKLSFGKRKVGEVCGSISDQGRGVRVGVGRCPFDPLVCFLYQNAQSLEVIKGDSLELQDVSVWTFPSL